jgi:hypothetical protein
VLGSSQPPTGARMDQPTQELHLCRSPRSPDSTAFPGATAATLGPEREEASRAGSSAADPDECLVAIALASFQALGSGKRSSRQAGLVAALDEDQSSRGHPRGRW